MPDIFLDGGRSVAKEQWAATTAPIARLQALGGPESKKGESREASRAGRGERDKGAVRRAPAAQTAADINIKHTTATQVGEARGKRERKRERQAAAGQSEHNDRNIPRFSINPKVKAAL